MTNAASANYPAIVSREQADTHVAKALRLFVGRGRQLTVKQLSTATGIKDRMIESAMCWPNSPVHRPLPNFALLSIASVLGSDFTNVWLKLAQQGAFDLPEDDPTPGDLAADNSDD